MCNTITDAEFDLASQGCVTSVTINDSVHYFVTLVDGIPTAFYRTANCTHTMPYTPKVMKRPRNICDTASDAMYLEQLARYESYIDPVIKYLTGE